MPLQSSITDKLSLYLMSHIFFYATYHISFAVLAQNKERETMRREAAQME
jgi:hypothetical protein